MALDPRLAPMAAAGASVLIYAAVWLVPLAGALISIWSPLPLVLYYRRQGFAPGRRAVLLAVAGALIGFYLWNPYAGLYYLYYGLMALILGELHSWGLSEDLAVAGAGLAAAVSILVMAFFLGFYPGGEMEPLWNQYWDKGLDAFLGASPQLAQNPEQAQELRNILTQTMRMLLKLSPGLILAGSIFLAWANMILARWLRRREENAAPLNTWKAPEQLVWVLIPAGALLALGGGTWFWIGANLLLVLTVVYFFQGTAIVAYWLEKKNAPPILKAVIIVLVVAEIYVVLAIAVAGLFDMWFNFRRLNQEPAA